MLHESSADYRHSQKERQQLEIREDTRYHYPVFRPCGCLQSIRIIPLHCCASTTALSPNVCLDTCLPCTCYSWSTYSSLSHYLVSNTLPDISSCLNMCPSHANLLLWNILIRRLSLIPYLLFNVFRRHLSLIPYLSLNNLPISPSQWPHTTAESFIGSSIYPCFCWLFWFS